jgi:hypothetical protein
VGDPAAEDRILQFLSKRSAGSIAPCTANVSQNMALPSDRRSLFPNSRISSAGGRIALTEPSW